MIITQQKGQTRRFAAIVHIPRMRTIECEFTRSSRFLLLILDRKSNGNMGILGNGWGLTSSWKRARAEERHAARKWISGPLVSKVPMQYKFLAFPTFSGIVLEFVVQTCRCRSRKLKLQTSYLCFSSIHQHLTLLKSLSPHGWTNIIVSSDVQNLCSQPRIFRFNTWLYILNSWSLNQFFNNLVSSFTKQEAPILVTSPRYNNRSSELNGRKSEIEKWDPQTRFPQNSYYPQNNHVPTNMCTHLNPSLHPIYTQTKLQSANRSMWQVTTHPSPWHKFCLQFCTCAVTPQTDDFTHALNTASRFTKLFNKHMGVWIVCRNCAKALQCDLKLFGEW